MGLGSGQVANTALALKISDSAFHSLSPLDFEKVETHNDKSLLTCSEGSHETHTRP